MVMKNSNPQRLFSQQQQMLSLQPVQVLVEKPQKITLKRLSKLEEIAESFEGVEKCFAIQAGREIRVVVKPDKIDEAESTLLVRNIVKRIESELEYPGQIKVVIIRETRVVDYAK